MRRIHVRSHPKRLGDRPRGIVAVGTRFASATFVIGLPLFATAGTSEATAALAHSCVPGPKADLKGCDFADANLTDAKLKGTYLEDANLDGAILTDAKLSDADLTGADLQGVSSGGITGAPASLPLHWKFFDGYLI